LNYLIEGIYTNIVTQNCEFSRNGKKIKPNTRLFFDTIGKSEEQLWELFKAQAFLMRAINQAQSYIEHYSYQSGESQEDLKVQLLISNMYQIIKGQCNKPFSNSEFSLDIAKVIFSISNFNI
jgi:hypothetical protein